MQVVIPVKSLSRAKARLSSMLGEEERECLARCMLEDVLTALGESVEVTQVHIVSSDEQLDAIAATFAARVVPDTAGNLNGALEEALAQLMASGTTELLILHADIPLVRAADIDGFIRQYRKGQLGEGAAKAISLVPAEADGGTNALILSPPNILALVFGEDSCRRFGESAKNLNVGIQFFHNTEMSLDIDTPDDLKNLMKMQNDRSENKTRTQTYLKSIDIDKRFGGKASVSDVASDMEQARNLGEIKEAYLDAPLQTEQAV